MKKILKLTSFLFFMIFSLNVHSQSEKLKELQQTLEDWENFSFELYVLKMDKDQVTTEASIFNWIYSIMPDQRNVEYFNVIVKK